MLTQSLALLTDKVSLLTLVTGQIEWDLHEPASVVRYLPIYPSEKSPEDERPYPLL